MSVSMPTANIPDRRLVAVAISFDLLIEMMRQDYSLDKGIRVVKGVPGDARMIGSFTDEFTQCGYLIFEHESFENVPLGTTLPRVDIEIERSA